MEKEVFSNISKIIERDSKSATYKYALLRGVIDIIQDYSPYITHTSNKVHFPLGLLIEKWMLYYYPILESSIYIPQIKGKVNLAFETQFKKIIFAYKKNGGYSAFYNDLRNKGIPEHLHHDFLMLAKELNDTIIKMPMRYIGRSFSDDFYSIFKIESGFKLNTFTNLDFKFLIDSFGTFSIPSRYFEAFEVLGSFISGQDSILFKWAEFSVKASGGDLSVDKVVKEVLKSPITERNIQESKKLFSSILKSEGKVYCVWTGKSITRYDVDHMIPFSIWKNNDLWNLLPSNKNTNNQKRDKIPSSDLIEKRKDLILYYWELLNEKLTHRFQKEIQIALLGGAIANSWQSTAIRQLQDNCCYLISNRGFEEWKP